MAAAFYDRMVACSRYLPISGPWQFTIGAAIGSFLITKLAERVLQNNPTLRGIVNAPLEAIEESYPGTIHFVTVCVKDNLPLATFIATCLFTSNFSDLSPSLMKAWVVSILNNRDPIYWAKMISLNILFMGMVCKFGDIGRRVALMVAPRIYELSPTAARLFYYIRPSDVNAANPA